MGVGGGSLLASVSVLSCPVIEAWAQWPRPAHRDPAALTMVLKQRQPLVARGGLHPSPGN